MIGQIIAGIILGLPFISSNVSSGAIAATSTLADFGIIFLLLLTGMQLDIEKFKKAEVSSVMIAVFCTFVPFLLGFAASKLLGFSTLVAGVVGACLSLTAEGANLDILMELGALNTKIGVVIMGAGILDDLFGTLFLSFALLLAHATGLILFPLNLLLFIVIAFLTFKLFPYMLAIVHRDKSLVSSFSAILVFCIIIASISVRLGLSAVLGALFAGMIIKLADHDKHEFRQIVNDLKVLAFSFVVPFFFIRIGMFLQPQHFIENWALILIVTFVATFGKIAGAIIATPFTNLRLAQSHLIGWGMNSRGAIELVIAEIARANDLIPISVYVAIVSMAVLTTLVFPFVLRYSIRHDRSILR